MALTREQKEKIVAELKEKIGKQKTMFFVEISGLKVNEMSELRKKLKEEDAELQVVKKTLMEIALEKAEIEDVEPRELKGELAIVFGYKDLVSPAKVIYEFAEENDDLEILGGYFEEEVREKEKVVQFAKLPSRDELLSRLVGSINAPVSNFVNVLQGNIRSFVYALDQIKVNKQ